MSHKATPKAWQLADYWNDRGSYAAQCLLELRDRIATLEEAVVTTKLEVIEMQRRPQAPAPAGGLVERVAQAIVDGMLSSDHQAARAAILAVSAWIEERHHADPVAHTAWEAARWLRQEVKR